MGLLSNLFDSESTSADSENSDAMVDGGLGLSFSNESYSQEIDEDGSSETTYDSTSFELDTDVSSILSSMSDSFASEDFDFG